MNDRANRLQRTSVESLGRFLMDAGIFCTDTHNVGLTEKERLERLRDDLAIALLADGEKMRKQVQETAEKAWEDGETFGFMEGMRAGARIVLALMEDGEIRI